MFSKAFSFSVIKSRDCVVELTHYHTMPHFEAMKIYRCGKNCEERSCLLQVISPFLTMFSTLYGTYLPFSMHFKKSSAICFNLDKTKILLSGNGLKGKSVRHSSRTDNIVQIKWLRMCHMHDVFGFRHKDHSKWVCYTNILKRTNKITL